MARDEEIWIARLTPAPGWSVTDLLGVQMGLDVWEHHGDWLVVAAPDSSLSELERRRLARVDRVTTAARYLAQQRDRPPSGGEG